MTDKDVWDVSFPDPKPGDIELWNSENYSVRAPDDVLLSKFYDEYNYVIAASVTSGISEEQAKEITKEKLYSIWQTEWFDGDRWDIMANDLSDLIQDFDESSEIIPSGLVLGIVRGWSPKGIGHKYIAFKCDNTGHLIEKLSKKFIPPIVPGNEEYALILPENGTLTFTYLKDRIDVDPVDDDEIYDVGTTMALYAVKPKFISLFTNLVRADAMSKLNMGLNRFCENCIATQGKKRFIDTYLMPIHDSVISVINGSKLPDDWNCA